MSDALSRAYVEIEPDFSGFNRSVDTGLRRATRLIESRIRAALTGVEDRFTAFGRQASSTTESAFQEMARDAGDATDDIADSIDRVSGRRISLDVDVDREGTFSRFLSSITGVRLPVAGFAALGTAASAAAAAVVQLAAELAPAAGIVAALPAAVGVAAAGIATLSVATMGVGDAFSAAFGDAEEFEAAMEGLAPGVQAAAQALRDMSPELDALRDRVQDAFFQDFDDVLTSLAETLMGPVSDGMTAVATEMNGVITRLAEVATSAAAVDFVSQSFDVMADIIARLQEPLAALFSALINVGNAVFGAFGEDAGSGLASLITRFAEFLEQVAATGQATQWVHDAMAVFSAIGDILSPIVGIISSIGGAATATGGNLLGVFGQALQVFDDFLASAQGQEVLITLFDALNQVGATLGTVLANIAPALPPIISGISSILSVVTPLLGPLSELVGSVLGALAPILGAVASAIQPLIGPLTEILDLLGPILVDAINTLMPIIELLADLLGTVLGVALEVVGSVLEALAPIITIVLEALAPLIEALTPLFDVLGLIAELIGTVLQPVIQVLGDILLWLVDTIIIPYLIPAVELLIQILTVVLVAAIEALKLQFEVMGTAIQLVWSTLTDVISQHAEAIADGWDILVGAFKTGWNILNSAVFTPLKNGFTSAKTTAITALSNIRSGLDTFVSAVRAVPDRIRSALSSLFSPLWSGFKSAINSVISGWNSLSFSIPSVDLGALGSVGGFTISTPNIAYLQRGGFTTGEGLAMLHPDEMVLPLSSADGISALAAALREAGSGGTGESGSTQVTVQIGSETITQMIDTQITRNNETMTRRARAGTGNRA